MEKHSKHIGLLEFIKSMYFNKRVLYIEPSAEETLPSIEKNAFPTTPKKLRPLSEEEEVSSGVSAVRPSSEDKF